MSSAYSDGSEFTQILLKFFREFRWEIKAGAWARIIETAFNAHEGSLRLGRCVEALGRFRFFSRAHLILTSWGLDRVR